MGDVSGPLDVMSLYNLLLHFDVNIMFFFILFQVCEHLVSDKNHSFGKFIFKSTKEKWWLLHGK